MLKERPKLKAALIAAGALLYTASPVDIVPEMLAGPMGFGDDAAVLVGSAVAIWRVMRRRRSASR